MRRIKKIKLDKKEKIILDWEVEIGSGSENKSWDEYHIKCSDRANPEFYNAIKNLVQDVILLLEFPDIWKETITVKGVSFSYSDNDVQGAVITAQRELMCSATPMNCNTPHKPFDSYNENECDDEQLMPEETQCRLHTLEEEAQKYIDGDRAQMNLFEENMSS